MSNSITDAETLTVAASRSTSRRVGAINSPHRSPVKPAINTSARNHGRTFPAMRKTSATVAVGRSAPSALSATERREPLREDSGSGLGVREPGGPGEPLNLIDGQSGSASISGSVHTRRSRCA